MWTRRVENRSCARPTKDRKRASSTRFITIGKKLGGLQLMSLQTELCASTRSKLCARPLKATPKISDNQSFKLSLIKCGQLNQLFLHVLSYRSPFAEHSNCLNFST